MSIYDRSNRIVIELMASGVQYNNPNSQDTHHKAIAEMTIRAQVEGKLYCPGNKPREYGNANWKTIDQLVNSVVEGSSKNLTDLGIGSVTVADKEMKIALSQGDNKVSETMDLDNNNTIDKYEFAAFNAVCDLQDGNLDLKVTKANMDPVLKKMRGGGKVLEGITKELQDMHDLIKSTHKDIKA